MFRKLTVLSFACLTIGLLAVFWCWTDGKFYVRLPGAEISLNDSNVNEARIYKNGKGDHLIFLGADSTFRTVYGVEEFGTIITLPVSPIPSRFTKSIRTEMFVLCLNCGFVDAKSVKVDPRAEITATSNGFDFHVYNDRVKVEF